jgi:cyanophycin synthetase
LRRAFIFGIGKAHEQKREEPLKAWNTFLGPSRFGPLQCGVAWPEDGPLPVPRKALHQLAQGFGRPLKAKPGSPRSTVANELALALASLLLPSARSIRPRVARAEHAVGLATWNFDGAHALVEVALGLVRAACDGREPEIPLERLKFLSPDEDELPEQTLLRNVSEQRGTFAHRLDLLDGSALLVLGSGSRQKRLLGLLPEGTAFAGHLATNKNVACDLLARAGIPVPEGETVTTRTGAHAVAARLGYPVTLKVATGSRQRGVIPHVISERALDRALDFFGKRSVAQELRVERHVPGAYFRCFVAAGEFVACATSPLPLVRGDGKRTIRELIPRQHAWLEEALRHRELGANAEKIVRHVLAGHDLALEDVLARNREVPVAFATSQGFAYDVTHKVHPENRALLVRAARVLGMFWTGIDVQAARIDVPLAEQGATIIEVNDIPAFAFHGNPLVGEGPGVDMGKAIFRAFFRGSPPDVPVVLVAGEPREAAHSAERIARGIERAGLRAAVELGETERPAGLDAALDPTVDAIVLAPRARDLSERGLGVPGIDVVVTVGDDFPDAVEELVASACRRRKGTALRRSRDVRTQERAAVSRVLDLWGA